MAYDPAVTERLLEAGTFVSFTMQAGGYDSLVDLRDHNGPLGAQDQIRKDALESYYDMKLDVFRRLLADGMLPRLVISTDAGPFDCEFGRMRYGLRLAVQAGMPNGQAIQAATRTAAQACGVAPLVGTLEPGKQADLLVVVGDPLVDIEALADVAAVYTSGRRVGPLPEHSLLPGVTLISSPQGAEASCRARRHPHSAHRYRRDWRHAPRRSGRRPPRAAR
jgi:hypothetical protein